MSRNIGFTKKDATFYHNYVFSRKDLERARVKWWEVLNLIFLPTFVQCSDGYAWFYKLHNGCYYYLKCEELSCPKM